MVGEGVMLRIKLTAHFDGRVIVPHEIVALPTGQPFIVEVVTPEAVEDPTLESRRAALQRLKSRRIKGTSIRATSLTRESMYDED